MLKKVFPLLAAIIVHVSIQNAFCSVNDSSFGYGGITLGTPGLLNLTAGKYWGRVGFQGSISFLNLLNLALTEENENTYEAPIF